MKMALGRGLGALIPDRSDSILEIDIERIVPNEYQPRKLFRDETLKELALSIKEKGIIQPIIVSRTDEGFFKLIAGERRWRAARMAGLKRLPAIVKDTTPTDALELALIENIQREDLTPIETAEVFQRLIKDFNLTHEELSKKIGKDRATVTNYLRILKLPDEVKRWIAEGRLSIGHAKVLLQVEDSGLQVDIARKIVQRGLSVRESESLVKRAMSPGGSRGSRPTAKDPQIASLEQRLIQHLGTKVRIHHRGKRGGKVEIEYYSLDELDRILEILMGCYNK